MWIFLTSILLAPFSSSLQPLIVNALGPAVNVSAAMSASLERPDRIQSAVSINNLVSLVFQVHLVVSAN